MSSGTAMANRAKATVRYNKNLTIYQKIFGEKAVWCRAIPHTTKGNVVAMA